MRSKDITGISNLDGRLPGTHLDYFQYMTEMDLWQREHPEVPVINISFEECKRVCMLLE